jgi:hypothetical protein
VFIHVEVSEGFPSLWLSDISLYIYIYTIFSLVCVCDWGLNSGLRVCKAGAVVLEPHSSPFCCGYFGHGVS